MGETRQFNNSTDDLNGERGDQRWRTTGHLLREAAGRHPERPAIVDVDRTLSYAELLVEAEQVSRALLARGVEIGDTVAIWAPNSWRWIASALGAQSIGAAIVPLNTRYKGAEARHILTTVKPRALFVATGFLGNNYLGMLAREGIGTETVQTMVVMSDDADAQHTALGWEAFLAEATSTSAVLERLDSLDGSTISDILFTSGTTGVPKGVVTAHAQNLRGYYDWSRLAGFRPADRYAIVNPFFHAFGYKAGWLSAIMHGMTVYPHAVLNAAVLLDQVERDHIQVLPGPPTLYASLLAEPGLQERDLSSLRVGVTGAASIPPILIRRLYSTLGFERVSTCYGMTEGSALATITRPGDDPETIARTSGRALPDIELLLVDETGSEVEVGQVGEVWIRGYNVMKKYFNAPAATAERVDGDGWLHSGDLGRINEQGNLAIVDRKGDMVIVGGFNAYPAEIESMLAEHPGIREVAVIGRPDDRLGEVCAAFVTPSAAGPPTQEDLISWARERMANFKVPRRVWIVEEFPRNATGKVLKGELRALADKLTASE